MRTLTGNEAFISLMVNYRRRDHKISDGFAPELCKKYYPKGALFYFECDEYGRQTGPAVFIKRVPDPTAAGTDKGWEMYTKISSYVPSIPELLSRSEQF